ncbi:ankyrin repeat-containing protein ITN1-like [Impatiens glandulifera]|uniref:ankyrin repeat-containing protein ITN1-like n=1 Tax=Impatiens glandulifera TaxID=253017 RepID=UPI001FB10FA6|nr:ankyrin repeat-containing protein ITN1-like [Impatiens glandulifera]
MEIEQGRDQRLYDAAKEGNVASLNRLIQEDPLILDPYTIHTFRETPLHLASMFGHLDFVKSILALKPELAKELDSRSLTPLHLASAKGYVEIVKSLLQVNKNMCFALDRNGMNPLHLAATKGRVDVLRELVEAEPDAARVKLDGGDTILHLCVENNKMEALEMLVQRVGDKEFLNSFDAHGNTILHLAVANKQLEVVRFLVGSTNIEVTTQNFLGLTPIDILSHSRRHVKDLGIFESLQSRGVKNNQVIAPHNSQLSIKSTSLGKKDMKPLKPSELMLSKKQLKQDWVKRKKESLMVVAILIATMGFQAGIYPPGGVWQDDKVGPDGHTAGLSILKDKNRDGYMIFLISNTIGFTSSLSVIFMLISGLPFRNKLMMWLLMMILWVSITATGFTYMVALFFYTSRTGKDILNDSKDGDILFLVVTAWLGLMALLFVAHTIRLIYIIIKKFFRFILAPMQRRLTVRNKNKKMSNHRVIQV